MSDARWIQIGSPVVACADGIQKDPAPTWDGPDALRQ